MIIGLWRGWKRDSTSHVHLWWTVWLRNSRVAAVRRVILRWVMVLRRMIGVCWGSVVRMRARMRVPVIWAGMGFVGRGIIAGIFWSRRVLVRMVGCVVVTTFT